MVRAGRIVADGAVMVADGVVIVLVGAIVGAFGADTVFIAPVVGAGHAAGVAGVGGGVIRRMGAGVFAGVTDAIIPCGMATFLETVRSNATCSTVSSMQHGIEYVFCAIVIITACGSTFVLVVEDNLSYLVVTLCIAAIRAAMRCSVCLQLPASCSCSIMIMRCGAALRYADAITIGRKDVFTLGKMAGCTRMGATLKCPAGVGTGHFAGFA